MSESKSDALPLGYEAVYNKIMVERDGFEPSNPKEQIYSLPRLATSLPLHKNGAENRTWTRNLLITSQLLYQLSYFGVSWCSHPDLNRNSISRSRFWVYRVYQFRHKSNHKKSIAQTIIKFIIYVPLAQPVEHLTFNQRVWSSNLQRDTILKI